jgi:hypothetical protein
MAQFMTQGALIVARHEVQSETCPVCRATKDRERPFCRECYFTLPEGLMRSRLYLERRDIAGLIEWYEAYQDAKDYLRKKGLHKACQSAKPTKEGKRA